MHAYVGSRTTRERHARGEGLTVYRVTPHPWGLERVQQVGGLVNPSYLALDAAGRTLYTVHGDQTEVSAFSVDRATGRLQWLNTQSTGGRNPVHLALDPAGRHLLVSNHLGGTVAVLPVAADGALGEVSQAVALSGPLGPHRVEQQQAKPHFNVFDPSGRFVLVPDKGLDRIFTFRFEAGRLSPATPAHVAAREGAGPRHLAFHPGGGLAYVVNELDATVTACRWDAAQGTLVPFQIVSTLPDTFTGNSRAAAVALDPAGRTLYASNRGHDSLAVFHIEPTGRLAFQGAVPTHGRTPRFFTLTPDWQRLLVLNEDSDTLVTFRLDPATGWPVPEGTPVPCGSPVCLVFSGAGEGGGGR